MCWLTSDNLYKLSDISTDYFVFGSSAMDARVSAGPLIGRPSGGTAILVKNKFAGCAVNIATSERFTVVKMANWLLICVYLPCTGTDNRLLLYSDVLQDLQSVISVHNECDCLIGGDFNTDLTTDNHFNIIVNNFIANNNLYRCDIILPVASKYTYINESLSCMSTIDYMRTSNTDRTVAFNILDIDLNLSDHLPIMAVCTRDHLDGLAASACLNPTADVTHFRWDHAPLDSYYEHTRLLLQPVHDELVLLLQNCDKMATNCITDAVDKLYENVVSALQQSADLFIPKRKHNFYKFWWNQELEELKDKSIASCRLWKDAGKPRQGQIHAKYKQDKLLYKKRLREERAQETCVFTNELHDALMHKSGQAFWKSWNSKFANKSNKILQVDGTADNCEIVNNFAKHFEHVCTPNSAVRNAELEAQYNNARLNYCGSPIGETERFSVELLSHLINEMKSGKAAGLDKISCEHLKFSHPIVVVILCKLFNLFVAHSYIPSSFGSSYTVPIPKCDGRSKSLTMDDFRGISISPVISKLFELAILDRFGNYFESSSCQFGFKKHLSCRHVVYSVRNVIEHYIAGGSTVNVCTIDLSKAFDRTNHFAMYIRMMERKIPIELLSIFELWFKMSATCVMWNGLTSYFFELRAGVRQGGVLSPFLFAIFLDSVIDKVKATNLGCHIGIVCVSIFLYADDILLIAPSVTGLQILLNSCENELSKLDMVVNIKKSTCIRFGPRFNAPCASIISIFGGSLEWVSCCKYLGVYFVSGRLLRCCFDNAKSKFFRAFNAIFSKVGSAASEVVVLNLVRSKCLPVLLYGVEACPFLARDKRSFEFTITRLFMKLFRTGSAAIVKYCQLQFNFLPLHYQIDIRTAKFLNQFSDSDNAVCALFKQRALLDLNNLYFTYGDNVKCLNDLYKSVNEQFVRSV